MHVHAHVPVCTREHVQYVRVAVCSACTVCIRNLRGVFVDSVCIHLCDVFENDLNCSKKQTWRIFIGGSFWTCTYLSIKV